MSTARLTFRCGGYEHVVRLSVRDVALLDAEHLFPEGWSYRHLFGLDFVRGLGNAPPGGIVLLRHPRQPLILRLEVLLNHFEDQRDLISHSYPYTFSAGPEAGRRSGGSIGGFRVRGLIGYVTVRPSGYCFVILSEVAPTGRGRLVQLIDMRQQAPLQTDDWGTLKVSKSKPQSVGWFDELPRLIQWLGVQETEEAEVLHA